MSTVTNSTNTNNTNNNSTNPTTGNTVAAAALEGAGFSLVKDARTAHAECVRMLRILHKPEDKITAEERNQLERETVENFANFINKGFLRYRKSVTAAGDYASVEWTGLGSIITDTRGREFIDALGGYGLYSAGIRHARIVSAVQAQLLKSPLYTQEMLDPLRAHLGKVLSMILPGEIQYGFYANSGTEAVEGALKLAKLYTGKSGFISFLGAFHGKSLGSLSVMGKAVFRKPLLPLLPGVRQVPFGDAHAVEEAIKAAHHVGDGIAAVIAEPVLGEAGAIVPPPDFWPKLRAICDKYGVLLIADEVQTGLGRTGKNFAVEHWGIAPDIICLGKALGGGVMPLSGFFSTAKVWSCLEPNPFMHTTTTGGSPVGCAAALAFISVLLEDDLAGQAARKGEYILNFMRGIQAKYPHILKEVRGMGLLLGMEFPSDEIGYAVAQGCFTRGLLTAGTLLSARTIRIEPALNIPQDLIERMLVIFSEVFDEIASQLAAQAAAAGSGGACEIDNEDKESVGTISTSSDETDRSRCNSNESASAANSDHLARVNHIIGQLDDFKLTATLSTGSSVPTTDPLFAVSLVGGEAADN